MKRFLRFNAVRHASPLKFLQAGIICLVLMATAPAAAFGTTDTLPQASARVSLEITNKPMVDIINAIRSVSDYRFLYSVSELDGYKSRDFHVVDADLAEVMEELLKGTNLRYEVENGVVVITPRSQQRPQGQQQEPQQVTVSGTVRDSQGAPLIGVSVAVKGTIRGTITDQNGYYRLATARVPDMVLLFSYVGMKSHEITYTGQASIDVTLETDTQAINEVVVTGMFERDKASFAGSHITATGDEIRKLTSNNVLSALAIIDPSFKMNLSNISGSNPSAVPNFTMRGQASFGDYQTNDAVVLRGDYTTRTHQPLFVLDGVQGVSATAIMDLDPEQVESITLLKDAAATVIYGSKAANGVVVVETKKPIPGKLRISYNGNYGIQFPDFSDYNLTNAREKLLVEETAGYFSGNELPIQQYHAALKYEVERGVNTDWLVIPVRNAFTHRHGLNFEGGDEALRYKIYLGASFTPGVMKETGLNTQSAKVDLQYRKNKFMIVNQVSLNYSKSDRESNYGDFSLYSSVNPYYTPRDDNGNIKQSLDDVYLQTDFKNTPQPNPFWNTQFNSLNRNKNFEMKESLQIEYRPTDPLLLRVDFQMLKQFGRTDVFKSGYHTSMIDQVDATRKGRYDYTNMETNSWRVNLQASYNKLFNEDHLLALHGRFTIGESDYFRLTEVRMGYPNDRLNEIFMGTFWLETESGGDQEITRDLGAVLTANYAYKSRYAVDFSARIDASTQFGKNNRYAPFWSAGLRWNIHNENFLSSSGFFDELVLRATYGITGSQSFSSWQALQMYYYNDTLSYYHGSDVVGAILKGMGNPDLKWQQTDNYNLGFDFSLLDNRISGTAEYYYKYTKNTLLDFSLAPSVGMSTVKDNLGHISNKGFEALLRFVPWRDNERQAYWNININAGHNVSKIEKISEAMEEINRQAFAAADDPTRPLPRYENGASMTAIWGVKSLGIDPQTGEEVFVKRDGALTSIWDSRDLVVIGNSAPKVSGSISTQVGYKGLSVSVTTSYSIGGDIYNTTLADKLENVNLRTNVDKRVLYDRWKQPGDVARFKKLDKDASKTSATSRFLMREDRFTLASVNVAYRLNRADSKLLQSLDLSSASLGFYVQDLFNISTIKRERGISYPFAHQVSLSLNIVF